MPKYEPPDVHAETGPAARGVPRVDLDAAQWFWGTGRRPPAPQPEQPAAEPRAELRAAPRAVAAALLGLVGLSALLVGQLHHVNGVTDIVVASVALGGTLAALVVGNDALRRARAERTGRGRALAFVGLAEAWLSVLVVFAGGLASLTFAVGP